MMEEQALAGAKEAATKLPTSQDEPPAVTEEGYRRLLASSSIYCLQAAYILCNFIPPCDEEQIDYANIHLEHEITGSVPEEVASMYRRMRAWQTPQTGHSIAGRLAASNAATESGGGISSVSPRRTPSPPPTPIPTITWHGLGRFCEEQKIALPMPVKEHVMQAQEHQKQWLKDPLYRIKDRCKNGEDVHPRCLSGQYWGLAEACYIVMGVASPRKYGNNIGRCLEKEAYDLCVRGKIPKIRTPCIEDYASNQPIESISEDHPWPVFIRDLYDLVLAAIDEKELIPAREEEVDGYPLYLFRPKKFLEWCQKKGILLREQLLAMIGEEAKGGDSPPKALSRNEQLLGEANRIKAELYSKSESRPTHKLVYDKLVKENCTYLLLQRKKQGAEKPQNMTVTNFRQLLSHADDKSFKIRSRG